MKEFMLKEIVEIVRNCEEIQKSDESRLSKEQAKLAAYADIVKLLDMKEGDEDGN